MNFYIRIYFHIHLSTTELLNSGEELYIYAYMIAGNSSLEYSTHAGEACVLSSKDVRYIYIYICIYPYVCVSIQTYILFFSSLPFSLFSFSFLFSLSLSLLFFYRSFFFLFLILYILVPFVLHHCLTQSNDIFLKIWMLIYWLNG